MISIEASAFNQIDMFVFWSPFGAFSAVWFAPNPNPGAM